MKTLYRIALVTAIASQPVVGIAQDDAAHSFSGNVTLASDYLFRGQSQTDNNPAIQGGFDYAHELGLYAGVWASNISFAGGLEMDYYAGFSGELANGLAWDLFGVYYVYPSSGEGVGVDYWEVGPSVSYTFGGDFEPSISASFLYSDDFSFNSGESWYLFSDFGVSLPSDFGLSFHVGRQTIDNPAAWGTPSWYDYNVSLSKTLGPYDFAVTYSDTDLSEAECFGGTNICDGQVVFSISGGF